MSSSQFPTSTTPYPHAYLKATCCQCDHSLEAYSVKIDKCPYCGHKICMQCGWVEGELGVEEKEREEEGGKGVEVGWTDYEILAEGMVEGVRKES